MGEQRVCLLALYLQPEVRLKQTNSANGHGGSLSRGVQRQLPCALKFAAKPALGREPGAPVREQHHLTSDLGLSLHLM